MAVALVGLGFVLGQKSTQRHVASTAELDQGIGIALGVDGAAVRGMDTYATNDYPGCLNGTCRQSSVEVDLPDGRGMQDRLYQAGWRLVPEQMPECVSDGPEILGWVCSYEKGDGSVIVTVQVEQPVDWKTTLSVWASTG